MKISACVITKNEEANIATCLESVKGIANEIILVDTGSTDNTVQEALKYGAKEYYFQWQNDFSKAKNYAISKAKGDWIVFLDADEYFTKESVRIIPDVLYEAERGNYDVIFSLLINYEKNTKKNINTFPAVRIFRNNKEIKYIGAIHEILSKEGKPLKRLDATKYLKIIHTGYTRETIDKKQKGNRNIEILLLEEEKRPNNSNICFYISEAYMVTGDYDKALDYANSVIKHNNGSIIGIYQKNYCNILSILSLRNYPREEKIYITRRAINSYPDFPDFRFYLGDFYRQEGRIDDAIREYELGIQYLDRGLNFQSKAPFTVDRALVFLAELYYKLGQFEKLTKCYMEILKNDIYEFSSLKKLLTLFSRFEKTEAIYGFMKKLYDYTNTKDLLFLLKASIKAKNGNLAKLYLDHIDESRQEDLKDENASIKLLNGDYGKAAECYKSLYLENYNGIYALKFIVSATLADDTKRIEEIAYIVKPSIKRITDSILKDKVQLLSCDKKDKLDFLREYIRIGRIDLLVNYMDWIRETDILYELAEMLFYYEQFEYACKIFLEFLEKDCYITKNKVAAIYLRLGECMYRTERYEEALRYYDQAREIIPHEYRTYEIPIYICELINDYEHLNILAQRGVHLFSDSFFLNSKLQV